MFVSIGIFLFFVYFGEVVYGDLGMVILQDVVIVIFNFGEFSEIMVLILVFKCFYVLLICIIGCLESSMVCVVDVYLCVKVVKEVCLLGLVLISSIIVMLVMGDVFVVVLLKVCGFIVEDFVFLYLGGVLGCKFLLCVNDIMYMGDEILYVKKMVSLCDVLLEVICKNFGMIVICDDNMMIEGIFIDGDLCCVFDMGVDVCQLSIVDVMTLGGICVCFGILVVEVLNLMQFCYIIFVMVVDGDYLFGVLYMYDLLCVGVV